MTDDTQTDISDTTEQLEQIIEQLETGDVPPERAKTLYEEGQELLAELDAALNMGDGDVEVRTDE